LHNPAFIYELVTRTSHEDASLVVPLVLCCKTPVTAMQMACRFASVASDAGRFTLHESPSALRLTAHTPAGVYVSRYQVEMSAWFLMQWLSIVRDRCRHALTVSVQFAHQPLFSEARYQQLYGGPVGFGAATDEMVLSGPGLHQPLDGHDEHLQQHYRHHAERYEAHTLADGALPQRVMLLLAQRLAFGKPEADDMAALLNLSQRSLQRQLQAHGTSWQALLDQTRQELACAELQQGPRSATTLAMLTGYEDTRAFLRAFKRWTGLTPSEYREKHRG
jgi:AraC-like DNA-binding protein